MKVLSNLMSLTLTMGMTHGELVAHWPLDTDATDASGNGYDGVVTNGTVNFGQGGANGKTGTAASFPDSGRIDIPFDQALNPESFTIALWANAASIDGFASPITSRDDVGGGVSTHGFILYNDSAGSWNFWTGIGSPGWHNLVGGPVVPGSWVHLALTYDALTETKTIWLNGEVAATETAPNLYSPNGTVEMENFHIGAGQDDGSNFFFDGLIDDVGVWNEVLDQSIIQSIRDNGIANGLPDPALATPTIIELALASTVEQYSIPITNNGQSQDLVVSAADFDGDPNFSVVGLPPAISPGESGDLVISFDPDGGNGLFEATLEVTSNDSLTPARNIPVQGVVHDPMLTSEGVVDLGESTSGTLTVTNTGTSRTLNISELTITGPDADKFSAEGPDTLGPDGGSGTITITLNPGEDGGNFTATLEIVSDDPLTPTAQVSLLATVPFGETLVAWWPLDVDGTDASGNGFDGTIEGVVTPAEGASPATGGSLQFDGASRIDVPFDPDLNPESFTVTLWTNAATTAGYASPITSRDDVGGGTSTHGYILYNDIDGNWNFWTGDGNPGWDMLQGGPVLVDTWTHVAISYDSATETKSIYLDGSLVNSESAPAQYSQNGTVESENLHLGAGQDDGLNFWFVGLIDDVALFRVPLSADEIATIIEDGVAGYTGASRPLVITGIELDSGQGEVSITFNSTENASYIIERSFDLEEWFELNDSFPSGGEVTTFTDSSLPPGSSKVFYRVVLP